MKLITLLSAVLFSTAIFSQTDDCAAAPALTVGSSCTTTNWTIPAGFTNSSIAYPACSGGSFRDGWYSFVATGTSTTVSVTNDDRTMAMAVYSSCSAASLVACADNIATTGTETATFTTTVGATYYVRIIRTNNNNANSMLGSVCVFSMPAGSVVMTAGGSASTCSGTFFDPGGSSNYADGITSMVFTICPSTAGAKMKAVFTAFQTENTLDYLEIFNGNSVAAPSLGVYTGTTGPGTVQATAANATGCLTFRFTSDGSINYLGWIATLSCVIPCQTVTSNWVSSNEAPMPDGIIRICQGQSLNLVGSGTFGTSGTGATYEWSMGNGVTVNGANVNYTYPAVGSYLANLIVTDANGCTNSNYLNRNIQVSTTPTIATSATPSTLCTNQTSTLAATVTMTPFIVNCTPPVSGTTFLPDGTGVSYSTSIVTNCYSPGATVTAATDITNICLNMEHSYSGDLGMSISCPNGQSVSLITYSSGTGSANLGTPWATGTVDLNSTTTTPGTGATYCFSPTASTTWVGGILSGGTFPNGNGPATYTDTYIPAGTYLPQSSLAGLVGCPLNGSWTITVTDNLGSDNGYIFNWDINFSAGFSTAASFTPTIASQGWVAAPTLTTVNATTAHVVPTATGAPCFTYSVTDNFGCTYTAPQCITVNCLALPVGLTSFEATAQSNERVKLTWETSSETNSDYFVIERSIDGASGWELIEKVKAAGNSQQTLNYSIFDYAPYNGTSYYRLSQYDLNGMPGTTDMEAVYLDFTEGMDLVLFPNPSNSLVSIKGDLVSLSTFEVLSMTGQNVRGQIKFYPQADGSFVMDISNLAAGVYTVKNGMKVISLVKE